MWSKMWCLDEIFKYEVLSQVNTRLRFIINLEEPQKLGFDSKSSCYAKLDT